MDVENVVAARAAAREKGMLRGASMACMCIFVCGWMVGSGRGDDGDGEEERSSMRARLGRRWPLGRSTFPRGDSSQPKTGLLVENHE
jgi:hypothetical protein